MLQNKAIFVVLILAVVGVGAGAYYFLSEGEGNEPMVLSFETNGGTGTFEDMTFSDSAEKKAIPADKPVRENADFKEWNTSSDGTGTSYAPGDTISLSESTTLYAIFECTLTFKNPYGETVKEKVPLGTYVFEASDVSVDGGKFKHWIGIGGNYSAGQSLNVTSHSEFTAYYTSTIAYFNANGDKIAKDTVEYNKQIDIKDFGQKVSWKVFTDWNTKKTGEGTSYNPGDKYTAKDIELHAQLRDWNILDSDVGTKFEYDVTGKILDLTQYEFINTLVGEANGLLTEYTTVTAEPVEATVAGTYTQTISAIDAETSEATYDRTGLVDVTLTVKFNGIEDMGAPQRTVLLAILKIQKNSDGEYLKDFTKTDVSITSTDNGFGIAGTGVIKVSEIDLITEEGAPYVNTVLNKSVTPVDVAGAGAVDKSSKIILDLDLSVTGKVEMTAALSGVEGLPWM